MSSSLNPSIPEVYYCMMSLVSGFEPPSIVPFAARSGIQHFVSISDVGEADM